MARYLRRDCRTLRDSLQLEMVAAQYLLRLRDLRSPEGVPVGDAAAAAIVAELEGQGDRLSLAILRALAYLDTGLAGERSAAATRRLAEGAVKPPAKFGDVGDARAVGAWQESGSGYTGERVLFVDFEHPLGTCHSLGLFVDPRHGGIVKHIGLMGPVCDLDPGGPFDPSHMETVAIPEMGALLTEMLERSYGSTLARSDDFRVLIAAARARTMVIPSCDGCSTPATTSRPGGCPRAAISTSLSTGSRR